MMLKHLSVAAIVAVIAVLFVACDAAVPQVAAVPATVPQVAPVPATVPQVAAVPATVPQVAAVSGRTLPATSSHSHCGVNKWAGEPTSYGAPGVILLSVACNMLSPGGTTTIRADQFDHYDVDTKAVIVFTSSAFNITDPGNNPNANPTRAGCVHNRYSTREKDSASPGAVFSPGAELSVSVPGAVLPVWGAQVVFCAGSPGVYTVSATAHGKTASTTITVTDPILPAPRLAELPNLTWTSATYERTETIVAPAVTGGQGRLTYTLTFGGTGLSARRSGDTWEVAIAVGMNATVTYTITVTDIAGRTHSRTANITVSP